MDTTDPQFYTARGRLTAYALACGYHEDRRLADGRSVRLSAEHGQYHVTVNRFGQPIHQRMVAERLEDARREFDRIRREGETVADPKFQRRHYEAIAEILGDSLFWARTVGLPENRLTAVAAATKLIVEFADMLERDNPAFARLRFIDAIHDHCQDLFKVRDKTAA